MASNEPESGPLGNRLDRPHHPNGWNPPRDTKPGSYPRTDGKSDGYPLGRGAYRKKDK